MRRLLLPALFLLLTACNTNIDGPPVASSQAYVPVYMQNEPLHTIKSTGPKAMVNPGKQYVFGSLLLQNELNEGIHFIDVSNPASPVKKGFLEIPLSTELAVKDGFLYTNNFDDLLVYDLRAAGGPNLVKRIENVFPPTNQEYPPFQHVNFECADPAKGVVIRWDLKQNLTVKCRR